MSLFEHPPVDNAPLINRLDPDAVLSAHRSIPLRS